MNRLLWIPICLVALLIPVAVLASRGQGGFDGVIRSIESKYGVRATRIPFLGLISVISRRATRDGVSGMHLAEFEDLHASVDGEELNGMVEKKLGPGWERVIRETGRKRNQQTLVFMHPEGNRMGLFVLDLDGRELDVVQVSVNPDHLNENLDRYSHHQEHNYGSDPEQDESE